MNEREVFLRPPLSHILLPQCLLGILTKIPFSQRPLCLAAGVTFVNKIMKKVPMKLRKMPEIRSLEKGQIP
jgi:hypothetical protein